MKTNKQAFLARLKKLLLWLSGAITGMFLYYTFSLANARLWNIGGEILFLPLMLLLAYLAYSIGKDEAAQVEYKRGIESGYTSGYETGTRDLAWQMERHHRESKMKKEASQ